MLMPVGIDKDILKEYILKYCGSNETFCADPYELQRQIYNWSVASEYKYKTLVETLNFIYNPIENYDRTEETTEDVNFKSIEKNKNNDTGSNKTLSTQNNTSVSETSSQNNINSDATNKFAGFDSTSMKDREKTNTINEGHSSGNGTNTDSGISSSDVTLSNLREENKDKTDTNKRILNTRSHGNIGVTTSQQMIEQERGIADFNLYYQITMDFENEFTIPVY